MMNSLFLIFGFTISVVLSCLSDLDCSLNGVCLKNYDSKWQHGNSICSCEPGWSGKTCNTLNFHPVSIPSGYGISPVKLTSWGGNILHEKGNIFRKDTYHLYVSAMMNNCPLSEWGHVSRIDHAVSHDPSGPFVFKDAAVGAWSHSPQTVKLKDGSFALFHIGTGDLDQSTILDCSNKTASIFKHVVASTIHVSKHYDGPWVGLKENSLPPCSNPAPFVHKNGTIFIICNNAQVLEFYRSEKIEGPWKYINSIVIDESRGVVSGYYEDTLLYIDYKGYFHIFNHVFRYDESHYECSSSTVSSHAYSLDGYKWFSDNQQPYTTQIELKSGEIMTVSTRETPTFLYNEDGTPTHLVNGVSSALACPEVSTGCVDCKYTYWDFTLVQEINLNVQGISARS